MRIEEYHVRTLIEVVDYFDREGRAATTRELALSFDVPFGGMCDRLRALMPAGWVVVSKGFGSVKPTTEGREACRFYLHHLHAGTVDVALDDLTGEVATR